MKIQCYMPVLDEADILPHVLDYMRGQGVKVHALDGWSSDDSYEMLQSFGPSVTVERFPRDGKDPEWSCRRLLHRVEDLAEKSDADWCLLSDADEWRSSSRAGENLNDAIKRVDRLGYNVVDHTVLEFYCVDDGWDGEDPTTYFRYYDQTSLICRLPQEKFWKNVGRVDLATHGGHAVLFDGKKVSPEKFLMRHYPYRTPFQARRKLQTRLARRCHEEHHDGWGVHYDVFPPGFSFCWDRKTLKHV